MFTNFPLLFIATLILGLYKTECKKCFFDPANSLVSVSLLKVNISGLTCPVQTDSDGPIKNVKVFLGIPYAEAPIGKRRFNRTVKFSWRPEKENVYNATQYKPACPQFETNVSLLMQEDCLYLNIFTPDIVSGKKYPVIFKVHGGTFLYGSSHLTPGHVLASQGLVVVTINYRLGVLGFLPFGLKHSNGNYGLWDQLEALQWVHDYISYFGGNNKLVTLMGESAGAASVHFLAVSPQVTGKDLFHRVFAVSGSMLAPWSILTSATQRNFPIALRKYFSCSTCSSTKLLTKMQNENIDLVLTRFSNIGKFIIPWAAVPDEEFLVKSPLYTLQTCNFTKAIPYLTSVTANESAWGFNAGLNWKKFRQNKMNPTELNPSFLPCPKDDAYDIPPLSVVKNTSRLGDYIIVSPMYKFTLFAPSRCFNPRIQMKISLQLNEFPRDVYGPGHGDDAIFHFGVPFVDDDWWKQIFNKDQRFQVKIKDVLLQKAGNSTEIKQNSLKMMKLIHRFALNGTVEDAENIADSQYLNVTSKGNFIQREERFHQLIQLFKEEPFCGTANMPWDKQMSSVMFLSSSSFILINWIILFQ